MKSQRSRLRLIQGSSNDGLDDDALEERGADSEAAAIRELGDECLVTLAAKGDSRAAEMLYRRHAPFAFNLAVRIAGSTQDVEDVVHDAFLKLWESGERHAIEDPLRYLFRMVRNLAMTVQLDDIARTVIKKVNDRPIRISDVARVDWGIEPMRGDASINGSRGVIMSITKAPGFDTLTLTKQVEDALRELQPTLPAGIETTASITLKRLPEPEDPIDKLLGRMFGISMMSRDNAALRQTLKSVAKIGQELQALGITVDRDALAMPPARIRY